MRRLRMLALGLTLTACAPAPDGEPISLHPFGPTPIYMPLRDFSNWSPL